MTPYELHIASNVYQEKRKVQFEERHTLVWMNEYYHRQKKLPPLYEALGKEKPVAKVMTDDEMLQTVKRLNKSFGGVTNE